MAKCRTRPRPSCRPKACREIAWSFERWADFRYKGQEHTVKVALPVEPVTKAAVAEWAERFHAEHAREYAFKLDAPVEIVKLPPCRQGLVHTPGCRGLGEAPAGEEPPEAGRREVDFDQLGVHPTRIYIRDRLAAGHVLAGPAVVEEPTTTVVIPPGWQSRVDHSAIFA